MRLVFHRLVQRHGFQDVEQLPLVFMDALDLDVEQRSRIDLDVETLADQPRQCDLVVMLDAAELLLERAVAGAGFEKLKLGGIIEHGLAAGLAQ